jgi:hypothetical protein
MLISLAFAVGTFVLIVAIRRAVADGTRRGLEPRQPQQPPTYRGGYKWHDTQDKRAR